MSDQDLVDQIQELAREIESMDDVSSVASESQRLSPSSKLTVLWAKKRFPRQGQFYYGGNFVSVSRLQNTFDKKVVVPYYCIYHWQSI